MSVNVLLKRSSTANKRPTAAQLDIGELSLNYDASTAGVFFEDSSGDVRKVGPVEVSATAPNATPAGSSGNSLGELWYDTGTNNLKIWTGASFVSATSSVAAGGSDTQVQFNSTGSIAGSANFTFDGTSASIAGLIITGTSTFRAAATQDGVKIVGRAGGIGDYDVTITPATLSADRTLTLADGNTTLQAGTMAITGGKLDQFAATTSAELAGVISDETGSGSLVFGTSPSFTTSITTGSTTFSLVDTTATTVNFAGAATALNVGAANCLTTFGGGIFPGADDTYDIGAPSFRWANVYTGDLHLSNSGGENDVDGSWGKYTIQEGEEDLFLINHRNGKKYKFVLQEV